jgi:hypothetical protein
MIKVDMHAMQRMRKHAVESGLTLARGRNKIYE